MLTHLTLSDFAIVSAAELALRPGMTVVSGETGAGKSLLVDALLSLTGARADAGMVRHGAERAELAAEFELADAPGARAWLRENELDDDGRLPAAPRDPRRRRLARLDQRPARHAGAAGRARRACWSKSTASTNTRRCSIAPTSSALLDAFGRHAEPLARTRAAGTAMAGRVARERRTCARRRRRRAHRLPAAPVRRTRARATRAGSDRGPAGRAPPPVERRRVVGGLWPCAGPPGRR